MNRTQFNRTEMFNTVSATLQENNTLWSAVPAIVQAMTEFNAKIAAIGAKLMRQEAPITGETQQKGNVRSDFEDKILEIAHALSALGAATHDMDLAAQGDLTLSQLDKMPDDALEETGRRIAALAISKLAALPDYGIVEEDITPLTNLADDFHTMKTAPRTAVAGRKGETDTLPALIRDTTTLLRTRLDKLMTRFKKTQPVFYAAYLSARVIVDKGNPAAAKQPAPAKQPQ